MVTATPGAPAAPQDPAAYGALFARYLEAGLQRSLAQVAEDPHKVADAVRSQAWHLLSFALRSPAAWPLAADLLLALSPKMVQAGYREQWLAYLEQGLACSREAGDTQTAAALQLEIGEVLRHLGRLAPAEACFQDALATFTAAGATVQAAAAQVCLANLLVLQEKWTQALALCDQALSAVPEVHPVRARALFVAADAFAAQQEDDQASNMYRESQQHWSSLGELRWVALCMHNLAWLAANRGDYRSAHKYYKDASEQFAQLDALHSQAVVSLDWGIMEYLASNYSEAAIHYRHAEKVFRQLNDTRYLAMACNNLGLLYLNQDDLQTAQFYYCESVRLWHKLGATLARINVEIGLAHIMLSHGDAQQAAKYLDQLQSELAHTERNQEHRRLYQEICNFRSQATAALWRHAANVIDAV
jgi:tetratricopeptide (TPR) repeat protein